LGGWLSLDHLENHKQVDLYQTDNTYLFSDGDKCRYQTHG